MVLDQAIPPIDKACGEGLLPDGIAILDRLGIRVPAHLGFHFTGIRFSDYQSSVVSNFRTGYGIGMRRTHLHALLLESAQELGVKMTWGAKQIGLSEALEKFDYVLAADGQHSQMRRQAGLDSTLYEHRRFGFRRHYRVTPWSSHVEVYWGPACQLYVTPVAPHEIGVALLSRNPQLRVVHALRYFPELQSRLARAEATSREMGNLSLSRKFRRVTRDRVALLGDASGSVDAITGEGISLSFQQALALAQALDSGHLETYQRAHSALNRRPRFMSSLLLKLDAYPRLQRYAFAGLASFPGIFSACLAAHVSAFPTASLSRKASFKHG